MAKDYSFRKLLLNVNKSTIRIVKLKDTSLNCEQEETFKEVK